MIRALVELTKLRITVLSTLSATTGYLLHARAFRPGALTASLGVLLLACGASALNQWQDRVYDAVMERTRRRPLPAGALSPKLAMVAVVVLLCAGLAVLFPAHGPVPALLGALAVAWYNLAYTYLKRVSPFAAVPGALIGALPPAIGWTASGGEPLAPPVIALCLFFFLWQVPHFWILLLGHGRDYEKAGLPSLTRVFSRRQLARLTFTWIVGTVAASLLLRLYGLVLEPWIAIGLAAAGAWLVWDGALLLRREDAFSRVFRSVNVYALAVMGLLVLDVVLV